MSIPQFHELNVVSENVEEGIILFTAKFQICSGARN